MLRFRLVSIGLILLMMLGSSLLTDNLFAFQVDEALSGADATETPEATILTMVFGGNLLGIVIVGMILFLSVVSVYFIIEHLLTITRNRIMPDATLSELEALIVHGEINKAIELCHQKNNYSLATEVVAAGLEAAVPAAIDRQAVR